MHKSLISLAFSPVCLKLHSMEAGSMLQPGSMEGAEWLVELRKAIRAAGGAEAVAASLGLSRNTVSRLQTGKPTRWTTVLEVARAVGVTLPGEPPGTAHQPNVADAENTAPGAAADATEVVIGPAMPLFPELELVSSFDYGLLGRAYEAATELFRAQRKQPDARQLMQATMLIYARWVSPSPPRAQGQADAPDKSGG